MNLKISTFTILVASSLLLSSFSEAQFAAAQELIIPTPDQFKFVPEPNAPPSLAFTGDAHYDPVTDEYILAIDRLLPTKNIRAFMQGNFSFCSPRYNLSFEFFNGSRLSGGGDIRAGVYYSPNISDPQFIAEIDNWMDGVTCPGCAQIPGTRCEPDNNHIAIEPQPEDSCNVLTSPYNLITGDWQKAVIQYDRGETLMIVNNKGNRIVLPGRSPYREGASTYLAISASTRMGWTNASNLLKIRNIKIEVLESCANSKTATEALAELDTEKTLDKCPISDDSLSLLSDKLLNYKTTGVMNSGAYEEALNIISNKLHFCNGSSECKTDLTMLLRAEFDKGFKAGAGSVDTKSIEDAGYKKGYRQCIVESNPDKIKQDAYRSGYSDGIASVDLESAKRLAYTQGFSEGQSSIECKKPKENKKDNKKIKICHLAGKNKQQTIEVRSNAVRAHLNHGDTLGKCKARKKPAKVRKVDSEGR